MEMKMLPSNTFTHYNFNGPSFNSFSQLSVHPTTHQLNSSTELIDNTHTNQLADHSTHLIDDNLQHNQLYELHHQQTITQPNYNHQSNLDNSNEELPVLSLFKLKSVLNQPKKSTPMQSMFSNGQELLSTSLHLLSSADSSTMNLVDSTHSSSLQPTSTPFYSNLAPSAIGTSAIVTTPMLISQSNSNCIDSMRNPTTSTSNSQLINFESSNLHSTAQNNQQSINSTNRIRVITRQSNPKEMQLRKFTCKYCNMTFQSKNDMQIHYSEHSRERRPYKCTFENCKKTFGKTNYLKQHLRVHTRETPFGCNLCEKRFKQQSHLKQHIRTHTGDKPYKCKYSDCDKGFSQESNLRSHMRSHESAKPFKCNSCHLTYTDENDLLAHIPKHRDTKHTKIFICDFCGKSYSIELYLSKHMQTKHGGRVLPPIQKVTSVDSSVKLSNNTNQSNLKSKTRLNKLNNQIEQRASLNHHSQVQLNSPSDSPSSSSVTSTSSRLINHHHQLNKINKKSSSSPSPINSTVSNMLSNQNTPNHHINYPITNNHLTNSNSWNKSTASSNSPDSVNSSNCMSSTNSTELINLTNLNLNNSGQSTDQNMFNDLNNLIPSRYNNLQQSVDFFYNHHHANTMMNNSQQHQSAFTALGRTPTNTATTNQSPQKYFNNNNDSFIFNKPSQTQYTIQNQLYNGQTINHHSLNNQTILSSQNNSTNLTQQHNLQQQQDTQTMSLQNQSGQLSPLNNSLSQNHLTSHNSNLITSTQTSPQLQHLQHNQSSQQHQNQLINLNPIRNYASMSNSNNTSASTLLQQQQQSTHQQNPSAFVTDIFLNAQNNNPIQPIQSMSSYTDYPVMIIE